MDLKALTTLWERHEEALALEYFEQYAGKGGADAAGAAGRARGAGGDAARMERIAEEMETLAREALEQHPREKLPPMLWQGLVSNRVARELTRHQNDTYRLRNEAVVAKARTGEQVNLNSVRLFNHTHARDSALRREVFEALMEKARVLTPTLQRRFRTSAQAWKPWGMTPLDVYLVEEQVSRERLVRTVEDAALAARPAFRKAADEFAQELFGKPFEFYDDMYVFRHTIFSPVDGAFRDVDFLRAFRELGERLGFPVESVFIDGERREGKYSSPVCFGVRIPGDVRVLFQQTSPIGDYESFYHEMGHALHFVSVEADRPFEDRRLIPNGVAEIFSTLFEAVSMDPVYLREDIGLSADVVDEVLRRRRFMELYFLTFYGANGLHKVRFWEEALYDDMDAADAAYEELTERLMGVRVPGRYWQTHHVMSMSDVYAPSYLLANIRKSEMVALLRREFGRAWWREPRAGAWLRERAMGPGGAIDLASFSKLDASAYVRPIVEGRQE